MEDALAAKALIAEAVAAISDPPRALQLLVSAWRLVPYHFLGDAIAQIGPIAARGVTLAIETDEEWLEAVAKDDPLAREILLATIDEGTPETRWNAILDYPDPRTAMKFVVELESGKLWARSMAPLSGLVRVRDPRVMLAWPRIRARWLERHDMYDRVERSDRALERAYPQSVIAAPPEENAAIARLLTQIAQDAAKPDPVEEELLAAIYANPGDVGPRIVYADRVQGRGDPRGELIALQLVKDPSPEQRERIDKIIERHKRQLLGPLAKHVADDWWLKFARGFLSSCRVGPHAPAMREWATVTSVLGGFPGTDEHPMPLVDFATDLDFSTVQRICALKQPPPITFIGLRDSDVDLMGACDLRRLDKLETISVSSTEYAVRPNDHAWMWRHPSVVNLSLPIAFDALAAWHATIAPTKIAQLDLETVTWKAKFSRDDDGGLGVLYLNHPGKVPRAAFEAMVQQLEAMPAGAIQRLQVSVDPHTWTATNNQLFQRVVARHPATRQA